MKSLRALLAWVALFEISAALRGLQGLIWSPTALRPLLAAPLLLAVNDFRRRPLRTLAALLLSLGPALATQLLLGLWRTWALDPLQNLRPGAPGRDVEELVISLSQGHLPALLVRPATPARGAVAIIHGSGCDKTFYVWRLVDRLLAEGLAVLLVDIDGHGDNPRLQSWPGIDENAAAAVTFLRARYPFVALIGYSLGGCLAAHAVANGVDVDALVVQEAPPRLQFGRREFWTEAVLLLRPEFFHVFADSNLYHFIRAWNSTGIRCTISTWDLITALDLPASLARISAPLLLVYGGTDAIVTPAQAAQVRAAAPAHATFTIIPAASHLSLILDPDAVRLTGDWLAAQLADRSIMRV